MENEDELIFERREITKLLLPWSDKKNELRLKELVEDKKDPASEFQLYQIEELSISETEKAFEDITTRFRSFLSSCNAANLEIGLFIKSRNGLLKVFLGFRDTSREGRHKDYAKGLIKGFLPGVQTGKAEYVDDQIIKSYNTAGLVSGIPTLKNESGKHRFRIENAIRTVSNHDFFLGIMAEPIPTQMQEEYLKRLISYRDQCFKLKERDFTRSYSETINEGGWHGNLMALIGSVGVGFGYTGERKSTNEASTETIKHEDSWAKILENIAQKHIDRVIQGNKTGFWRTRISFLTDTDTSGDLLAGSLLGELSKPGEGWNPMGYFTKNISDSKSKLLYPYKNRDDLGGAFSMLINSEELSFIGSPPSVSIPGYEIKSSPDLALTDTGTHTANRVELGCVSDHSNRVNGSKVFLSTTDLNKHIFVGGMTGTGKTTTIQNILKQASEWESPVPFLVIELAKRDYRKIYHDSTFKRKLNVFTPGDETISPFRINPFYVQPGIPVNQHIDYLKALFNASFSLYGPMPHILERCLHKVYKDKGWDFYSGSHPYLKSFENDNDLDIKDSRELKYIYPRFNDLLVSIDEYIMNSTNYRGELRDNIRSAIVTRLESLCTGSKGALFNTHEIVDLDVLLNSPTIIELEGLTDDDDKAFFVGLMIAYLTEYRQLDKQKGSMGNSSTNKLKHLLVVEEAHRLLKNTSTERTNEMLGNPRGKAVEFFTNMLAELRSAGQGVIVSEQIPTKISPDVVKNSNTKIIHKIVGKDDHDIIAPSLCLEEKDKNYMSRLMQGRCLIHKEGMEKPVECFINSEIESGEIPHETVKEFMNKKVSDEKYSVKNYEIYDDSRLKIDEIVQKLLHSLATLKYEEIMLPLEHAFNQLNKLVLDEQGFLLNKQSINELIVISLLNILQLGCYQGDRIFPKSFSRYVIQLLKDKEEKDFYSVREALATYWNCNNPSQYILNIISSDLIKENDLSYKQSLSTIQNYFIMEPSWDITKEVQIKCGIIKNNN